MQYKKILIYFFVVLVIIFSVTYILRFSPPTNKESLSLIPENTPIETEVVLGLKKIIEKGNQIQININENDVCYWIKTTNNGTNYLLQINKYKKDLGKCIGFVEDRQFISYRKSINVIGDSCVCGVGKYLFRMNRNNLEINLLVD